MYSLFLVSMRMKMAEKQVSNRLIEAALASSLKWCSLAPPRAESNKAQLTILLSLLV